MRIDRAKAGWLAIAAAVCMYTATSCGPAKPSRPPFPGTEAGLAHLTGATLAHRVAMPDPAVRQPAPSGGVGSPVWSDTCIAQNTGGFGLNASITRLRGWVQLHGGNPCDNEIFYSFEPDIADAIARGVPLESILHAGNAFLGCEAGLSTDYCKSNGGWWAVATTPLIKVELPGWNATRNMSHPSMYPCRQETPPRGWTVVNQIVGDCTDDPKQPTRNSDLMMWPFNPVQPDPNRPTLETRQYAEIEGSLVADFSHCYGDTGQLLHMKQVWGRLLTCNAETGFGDLSRWTEIHPPDRITLLDDPNISYSQWLVIAASPYADQDFIIELSPRTAQPAGHAIIDYSEHVIVHDRPEDISRLVDVVPNGLRVHVFGKKGGIPGSEWASSPRYMAVYRVGWQQCTPRCRAGECGSDGCRGVCSCPDGKTCFDGQCRKDPPPNTSCTEVCDQDRRDCIQGCVDNHEGPGCKTGCGRAHKECLAAC